MKEVKDNRYKKKVSEKIKYIEGFYFQGKMLHRTYTN